MSASEQMRKNVMMMNALDGFSVIIVCCSNANLANYWQKRLELGKGSIVSKNAMILCVFEDWPGGAGNGLGTLYAFQKAAALAKEKHNTDLSKELSNGSISVALYHTAGKGTRLAPIPGSENNNKPGVKLPAMVELGNSIVPITILESVIKQTGGYAGVRAGRLSVFWGDQIFIPSVDVQNNTNNTKYHADILCSLGPMIETPEEWVAKGMDKYGLIALLNNGNGAQVEKVDHTTAVDLLKNLGDIVSVGVSLGSFSVSSQLLSALLNEFAIELAAKSGKLDTDPHFWMPMTLERASYIFLMKQKKVSEEESGTHFDRIQIMLTKYNMKEEGGMKLFGPCDVGTGIYWWDYGQLKYYQKNALLIRERSEEAEVMRLFFGVSNDLSNNDKNITDSVVVSTHTNDVINSNIKDSVVCNVKCNQLNADGCIVINCIAKNITAKKGSILYNIVTDGDIVINDDDVQVALTNEEGEQTIMASSMEIDGGVYWDKKALDNKYTFHEVYSMNDTSVDPSVVDTVLMNKQQQTWDKINA